MLKYKYCNGFQTRKGQSQILLFYNFLTFLGETSVCQGSSFETRPCNENKCPGNNPIKLKKNSTYCFCP